MREVKREASNKKRQLQMRILQKSPSLSSNARLNKLLSRKESQSSVIDEYGSGTQITMHSPQVYRERTMQVRNPSADHIKTLDNRNSSLPQIPSRNHLTSQSVEQVDTSGVPDEQGASYWDHSKLIDVKSILEQSRFSDTASVE